MLKICLCSDNHGDIYSIKEILNDNVDCDYYFHLGDSMLEPEELSPFISVKGNNDWDFDYDNQRIVELNHHRILLIHGSGYVYNFNNLLLKAESDKCDVVFFGHTHEFMDDMLDNVRIINPGSCVYNRDGNPPSYAIVYIDDDGTITVEKKILKARFV